MNKAEYFALVREWERVYGKPPAAPFDPTKAQACCKKCGKQRNRSARHHKANDFFFALWFPQWFAARYIQYHHEDCDRLCEGCHKRCHAYFAPLAKEMYVEFDLMKAEHGDLKDPAWKEWALEWKAEFLKLYTKWISQPYVRRPKKRRLDTKHEVKIGENRKGVRVGNRPWAK